ncbi:MAG TPA: RNA methyltransferase [Acidimicrobiales bacterium]|nr:RNA methyltransferase [Acidimicrobiales bacterium]
MVEGTKLVEEALEAGAAVEALYWSRGAPAVMLDRARDAGVPTYELAPGVLERVADAVTPQPVMAVVGAAPVDLTGLRDARSVLVCDQVRDPGNAGTLVRTARAAGVDGVVWCRESVDVYSPKTVRASAGAVFRVPFVVDAEPGPVMAELGRWGFRRLAAVPEGGRDYGAMDLSGRFALMVGNESHGLGAGRLDLVDDLVSVPMSGGTESLNVGVATAVICFEAARQRRTAGVGP